jgi:predicted RNase H-like HicB family nuclease
MQMAESMRVPIRVIFYKEGDTWLAHCLEFDLIGDGETREEALERLWEAMTIQIEVSLEHNNPANLFNPADGRFFEMFAAGKDVAIGELRLHEPQPRRHIDSVQIEDHEYREYIGGATCGV